MRSDPRKPKMTFRQIYSFIIILTLIFVSLIPGGCGNNSNDEEKRAYAKEIKKWQAGREKQISREDGWLSLAGLYWLNEGNNTIGTDPSGTVILPDGSAPARAGTLILRDGNITLAASDTVTFRYMDSVITKMNLISDESGKARPTIITAGSVSFFAIKRSDKTGIRIKDKNNPALKNFKGLDFFPLDPAWRIAATYIPYAQPKIMEIASVIGTAEADTFPGTLVFKIDGKQYNLDVTSDPGSKELYLMFTDETTGKETYGNGRQLNTSAPDEKGNVMIDFNKAVNWPCAYTTFATCPIPPKQNHIGIRITAGEKKYPGSTDH